MPVKGHFLLMFLLFFFITACLCQIHLIRHGTGAAQAKEKSRNIDPPAQAKESAQPPANKKAKQKGSHQGQSKLRQQ